MKREDKFKNQLQRLVEFGESMTEADQQALEFTIIGEFEDLLPTYKNISDDPLARLYEYAKRGGMHPDASTAEEEILVPKDEEPIPGASVKEILVPKAGETEAKEESTGAELVDAFKHAGEPSEVSVTPPREEEYVTTKPKTRTRAKKSAD